MPYNSGFILLYFTAHYIYTVNLRVKWIGDQSVPFLITEWEGMYFTTQRIRILYLGILNVTILVTKNCVLFPLHTAMKSVHTNNVLQCSLVTR